jgi:hypothetical protein
MSDAAKILHDLEALTRTVDLDRNSLARLTMSDEQTKDIQHHIARCLHSLRELEFVIEGRAHDADNGADFLI